MKNWLAQIGVCATALTLLIGQPGQARADLIANGGFETPTVTPGTYQVFNPGSSIGGAWNVVGNPGTNALLVQTTYSEPGNGISQFNAQQGLNSLDLTGAGNLGPSVGINQTVATIAGQNYSLSFYVGRATPTNGPGGNYSGPATVDLSINGGPLIPFTNSNTTNGMVNWQPFNHTFTATGANTSIAFYNGTPVNSSTNEAGLDNVSLKQIVPEPSSGLLLAMGVTALAAGRRLRSGWRRRKAKA